MKNKRILSILAILLVMFIGNYSRLTTYGTIRAIDFLSVFLIGAATALLVREVVSILSQNRQEQEKQVK